MTIHFINPFRNAAGGSEWRILTLYDELIKYCKVKLWAHIEPDKQLSDNYPIKKIQAIKGIFPKFGVFVFVGSYLPENWIYYTMPERSILICNTYHPKRIIKAFKIISVNGKRKIEISYASKLLLDLIGIPGIVEPSLINILRFRPDANKSYSRDNFTVGRLSRDVMQKHHSDDPNFYKKLIENGCNVKIMGGTCLNECIREHSRIELKPILYEAPEVFLRSLDCFYYRTSDSFVETFARVVFEALATGLPVVCHKNGGYSDYIENGVNGFLFENENEAFDIIMRLKNNPELRKSIGMAGRQLAERLYGTDGKQKIIDFYLRK